MAEGKKDSSETDEEQYASAMFHPSQLEQFEGFLVIETNQKIKGDMGSGGGPGHKEKTRERKSQSAPHNNQPVQAKRKEKNKTRYTFRLISQKKGFIKYMTMLKTVFTIYLAITGLVTFSLFILEESLQTAMFSTWAAKDAQDWTLVMKANRFFKGTNQALGSINKWFGWVNPFSYKAYDSYHVATDFVVKANEAQIANFEPELFVYYDEPVFLHLRLSEVHAGGTYKTLVFGKFCVVAEENTYIPQIGETIEFFGKVSMEKIEGKILLKAENLSPIKH